MTQAEGNSYHGNPNLKPLAYQHDFSQEEIEEYIKCKNDPVYFTEKHIKIVNVDEGLVSFNMYKYQKKLIKNFQIRKNFSWQISIKNKERNLIC